MGGQHRARYSNRGEGGGVMACDKCLSDCPDDECPIPPDTVRICINCRHEQLFVTNEPCDTCYHAGGYPNWEPNRAGKLALKVRAIETDLAAAQSQVQRVREALGILEPADDLTECGDQTYYNGVWAAIEAVDAALDQEEVVGGGN